MKPWIASLFLTAFFVLSSTCIAMAGPGDADIQYNLGLAARENGETDRAYGLFKAACMARDGAKDACLAWGEMAGEKGNEKDVKRALGSAVMLAPEDIRGRFALAVRLLEKKDYIWAIEHLSQALSYARSTEDKALLRYYLGYALYKKNDLKRAAGVFVLARPDLVPQLKQRADVYLALMAEHGDNRKKAAALFQNLEKGEKNKWTDAANEHLIGMSAFPKKAGIAGQVSASFGFNTHPTSAFLDDPESEKRPVLQSVFRGDAIYGKGRYRHSVFATFTAYREQNWVELGEAEESDADASNPISAKDLNITLFLAQAAYIHRVWFWGVEHEIRAFIDGETQFLDYLPQKTFDDSYISSPDPFGLGSFAVGGKLWWSMAASRDAVFGARLKVEVRPNYIDQDRSGMRLRLRLIHMRYLLDRALQLKFLVGTRYDRTYRDPVVVKFDRLVPEAEVNLRWTTPIPRVTGLLGGKLRYNWYLNSKYDQENSFRPAYVPSQTGETEESESQYYDLTRRDLEWEVNAAVQVALWWKAVAAITYLHHQRISNIDDAWVPDIYSSLSELGYDRDVVMLELKQGF